MRYPCRNLGVGSARKLAYEFALLDDSMARFLEFEAAAEVERRVNEEDEQRRQDEENAARRQHEEIEALKRAEIERAAALVQAQNDEWAAEFYEESALEREPTAEDIAKLQEMKMDLAASDSRERAEMNDPAAIRAGTTAAILESPLYGEFYLVNIIGH